MQSYFKQEHLLRDLYHLLHRLIELNFYGLICKIFK